ncbi:hypothetical protein BU23DRAFT_411489, partial [Bimuria novae-zelandiae CBS 107.79]
ELYSGGLTKVTVEHEDDAREFHIHKALIMHHSEYFRGALRPDAFQEGETGEVTLRDIDPNAFAIFVD